MFVVSEAFDVQGSSCYSEAPRMRFEAIRSKCMRLSTLRPPDLTRQTCHLEIFFAFQCVYPHEFFCIPCALHILIHRSLLSSLTSGWPSWPPVCKAQHSNPATPPPLLFSATSTFPTVHILNTNFITTCILLTNRMGWRAGGNSPVINGKMKRIG